MADVVLVTDDAETLRRRQPHYDTLRSINDRLILASLTPFGTNGPRRRWKGSDLVAWASSGALLTIGDPDRRPVAPGGGLAYAAGSLNAVAGVMLALRARSRTGRGQMVDISLQEAVMSVAMEGGPLYTLEGGRQIRIGPRRGTAQGHFPTKDGFVELLPFMPGQWDSLAEWIRDELGIELATMDTFRGSVAGAGPLCRADRRVGRASLPSVTRSRISSSRRSAGASPAVPSTSPPTSSTTRSSRRSTVGSSATIPDAGPMRWPRPPLRFGGVPMGTGTVPRVGEHNDEDLP